MKQKAETTQAGEPGFFFAADTSPTFCFKIVCFLFQIYKRVLERHVLLTNAIVSGLAATRAQVSLRDPAASEQARNARNVNGLHLTLAAVLDFILDNVLDSLGQIKSESLNLAHFKHLQSIIDSHLKWLNHDHFLSLISQPKPAKSEPSDPLLLAYTAPRPSLQQKFLRLAPYKSEREKSPQASPPFP